MTLHSPSFSSRVFLCVCHAAVSLIPNWKEEHAQIKAKKIREKPICGCFFCVLWHWSIENRFTVFDFLISEFAPSVLTENLIWREKQLKVTSIVFWKNAKNFSENEKLLRNSDRRVKKRCVRLHKNWKRPIWLTWIVTLIRSRNKFSESFFFRSLTILAPKTSRKCLTI